MLMTLPLYIFCPSNFMVLKGVAIQSYPKLYSAKWELYSYLVYEGR